MMVVPTGRGDKSRRYVEDAVNLAIAYFDSAVQAMNDKADQVGRSAIQNKGMIKFRVARSNS